MKLPCKVIEDILPLYHDDACSPESRALVEEHLRECESCRTLLSNMDDELRLPQESADRLKPLQGIRSEWIKIKKRSLLKGAALTLLAVLILLGGYWGATQWRFLPISTDVMEVTDLCVLSDGTIAFHLLVNDGREFYEMHASADDEEGIAYITPKRALLESQRLPFDLNDRYFYMELYPWTGAWYLDPDPALSSEINAYIEAQLSPGGADYSFSADITKVCLGTKTDNIVLWESGMELPAASEQLEELYCSGIR